MHWRYQKLRRRLHGSLGGEEMSLFKRKVNRLCVFFKEYGYVEVATEEDDCPIYETDPPRRIGDLAIIRVEGQRRMVMLLRSHGHVRNGLYLVDRGKAA